MAKVDLVGSPGCKRKVEAMPQMITLEFDMSVYEKMKVFAKQENRTVHNFIETAALKYIEHIECVDIFEMEEIANNADLRQRLKQGSDDAKNKQGCFVE